MNTVFVLLQGQDLLKKIYRECKVQGWTKKFKSIILDFHMAYTKKSIASSGWNKDKYSD